MSNSSFLIRKTFAMIKVKAIHTAQKQAFLGYAACKKKTSQKIFFNNKYWESLTFQTRFI